MAAFGATAGVFDLSPASVIRWNGRTLFYGMYLGTSNYVIFVATGEGWNDPVLHSIVVTPRFGLDVVQSPTVFVHPDTARLVMVYGEGRLTAERQLVVAESEDGLSWRRVSGSFLSPNSAPVGWDYWRVYTAGALKRPGGSFADLATVGGQYLFFYSGSGPLYGDATGLLRVTPARPAP